MNPPESANPSPLAAPPAKRPRRRIVRWILKALRAAELCLALFGLSVIVLVATPATNWLFAALDVESQVVRSDYIVCLGGDLSRVIEAARLLNEGAADAMIVSNHGAFADAMKTMAVQWGADPSRVLVDRHSWTTRDHAQSIAQRLDVDPANDSFIVVTSYSHMARAKACFEKAGYRRLILRQPRWEREHGTEKKDWKWRVRVLPKLVYEYAAWTQYWLRGDV